MSTAAVRSPGDLKKLSSDQLHAYAEDVRQTILSGCLKNGGHLGASLGAVELAIALHYVFDSPREKLIWDVGHQAYAHKIITGRAEAFANLRQLGGISGFLSREESEHDVFGAGHSSTSISAALAVAWTQRETENWTVAVIGDGGLTAGLPFEALNNVRAQTVGPMLVVLNDNQMSISPNVGAVPSILSGEKAKEFFSLFGFDYVGPIDGHNVDELIGTLKGIRESGATAPVVLHALTQKGKGYAPAEENPGVFHGISPVQEKVGDRPAAPKQKSFSEAFGDAMCKLAGGNSKLVAITAAMPDGTGLVEFSRKYPDRFFDVGIAESHAVTFAAGLATQGFRPVVAVYSTFLQRGLDSIIHDVALQKLPVIFAIDRAGLVGADGPTHHGMFDLAYLGMIPGIKIFAPETLSDMDASIREALQSPGPTAIRYPRGSGPENSATPLVNGLRLHLEAKTPQAIVVSAGAASKRVAKAVEKLDPSEREKLTWISAVQLKPVPEALRTLLKAGLPLLCVEDGVIHGGFGQQIGADRIIGFEDHFITHGAVDRLETLEHLSAADIEKEIRALLSPER